MKKLCSILLALVFAMSLCTGVLATEVGNNGSVELESWDGQYTPSTATSFTIKKSYTSASGLVPGETLNFTVKCTDSPVERGGTVPMISIGQNNSYSVTENQKDQSITVAVPSYSVAGIYKYEIKETEGQTAGVTYETDKTIYVAILVEYDNENHKLVIGNGEGVDGVVCYIENRNGTKTDTFANTFATGSFTVAKDVQGNMADENDEFTIQVTLTSDKEVLTKIKVAGQDVGTKEWTTSESGRTKTWTYTTTLKLSEYGGATTFANIPAGVTVSVAEETQLGSEYKLKGYKIDNAEKLEEEAEFTVANGDNKSVVVVNERTKEVDTGVNLDSLPYILLLLAVCAGLVFFVTRKSLRRES